jgi:hypothetical protein
MIASLSKYKRKSFVSVQRAFSSVGTLSRYWEKLIGFTVTLAVSRVEVSPR